MNAPTPPNVRSHVGVVVAAAAGLLLAGCSTSSGANSQSAASASESSSARAGAVEALDVNGTCTQIKHQDVCGQITSYAYRYVSADGTLEPVNWSSQGWTWGKDTISPGDPGVETKPPSSFSDVALYQFYQKNLTHDMCVNVKYNNVAGGFTKGTEFIAQGCNSNTGKNTIACDMSAGAYVGCFTKPVGKTNAEWYRYSVENYPIAVSIQNSLPAGADLTLTSGPNLAAMFLDTQFGNPGKSIPSKSSVNWLGYRAWAKDSTLQLTYTVGGTSSISNTKVNVSAQVDRHGWPTFSKCSVSTPTSYVSVFCDVDTSPVNPSPSPTDGSSPVNNSDPVQINISIHQ